MWGRHTCSRILYRFFAAYFPLLHRCSTPIISPTERQNNENIQFQNDPISQPNGKRRKCLQSFSKVLRRFLMTLQLKPEKEGEKKKMRDTRYPFSHNSFSSSPCSAQEKEMRENYYFFEGNRPALVWERVAAISGTSCVHLERRKCKFRGWGVVRCLRGGKIAHSPRHSLEEGKWKIRRKKRELCNKSAPAKILSWLPGVSPQKDGAGKKRD